MPDNPNLPALPADLGALANQHAQQHVFTAYYAARSDNTVDNYRQAAERFAEYLLEITQGADMRPEMYLDEQQWRGVTWGLVEGFKGWLIREGFAAGTIDLHLICVRKLCALAYKAGVISREDNALIQEVDPLGKKGGAHVDGRREVTRLSTKKSAPTAFSVHDAACMKQQPQTAAGRRNRLLICLLADHGVRISEALLLTDQDVNLIDDLLRITRKKVHKVQIHALTNDTAQVLHEMKRAGEILRGGPLLRRVDSRGNLLDKGLTVSGARYLIDQIGTACGVENLSAHDFRHFWASYWAGKVDAFQLLEAGGWSNMRTVMKYVHMHGRANEGMTAPEF